MSYLTACLIGLLLILVLCAAIVAWLFHHAPEGTEIDGVGFVRKPK